jgi:hypothetical protein
VRPGSDPSCSQCFQGGETAQTANLDANDDDQKNITGDIFAYLDPTGLYREFELFFDKSKRLQIVYIFPYSWTWDQCKAVWGENVVVTKKPDGMRFYTYKDRRLAVYVQKNGTVISYYVF